MSAFSRSTDALTGRAEKDPSVEITAELKNSEPFKFKVVGLKDVKVFQGDQAMPEPIEFPAGQHKFVIKGNREDR